MAEAKLKLGDDSHPLPPSPHRNVEFKMSQYFEFFRHKKTDFITIKCNQGQRYQTIDPVRKLLARSYASYVVVRSPKEGVHWHAVATGNKKPLRVRRGVHLKMLRVGSMSVSRANRKPREDPLKNDAGIFSQLRYVIDKMKASAASAARERDADIIDVLFYLFKNLQENVKKDVFGNFAARFN